MRARVISIALSLSWLAVAPVGGAQPGARVEAAIRLRQADVAERRGDLPEARRLLELAVSLGAHPTALRA